MTAKAIVKGNGAHPFYKWANDELGWRARPKWNFHKYLIGRDGSLQGSFSSMVSTESSKLRNKITQLLKNKI
jgi:glutathione peroxidase